MTRVNIFDFVICFFNQINKIALLSRMTLRKSLKNTAQTREFNTLFELNESKLVLN